MNNWSRKPWPKKLAQKPPARSPFPLKKSSGKSTRCTRDRASESVNHLNLQDLDDEGALAISGHRPAPSAATTPANQATHSKSNSLRNSKPRVQSNTA